MEEIGTLTPEELDQISSSQKETLRIVREIGHLELRKSELLNEADRIKSNMAEVEKSLIEKFGPKAVIDINTGTVKAAPC